MRKLFLTTDMQSNQMVAMYFTNASKADVEGRLVDLLPMVDEFNLLVKYVKGGFLILTDGAVQVMPDRSLRVLADPEEYDPKEDVPEDYLAWLEKARGWKPPMVVPVILESGMSNKSLSNYWVALTTANDSDFAYGHKVFWQVKEDCFLNSEKFVLISAEGTAWETLKDSTDFRLVQMHNPDKLAEFVAEHKAWSF